MSSPLYRLARWQHRRKWQLIEEPTCRFCREIYGRSSVATVADHIQPHNGDEDKFWNGELQSLCDTCHSSVKQELERTGRIKGCRADGTPIDPNHPWNRKT